MALIYSPGGGGGGGGGEGEGGLLEGLSGKCKLN